MANNLQQLLQGLGPLLASAVRPNNAGPAPGLPGNLNFVPPAWWQGGGPPQPRDPPIDSPRGGAIPPGMAPRDTTPNGMDTTPQTRGMEMPPGPRMGYPLEGRTRMGDIWEQYQAPGSLEGRTRMDGILYGEEGMGPPEGLGPPMGAPGGMQMMPPRSTPLTEGPVPGGQRGAPTPLPQEMIDEILKEMRRGRWRELYQQGGAV